MSDNSIGKDERVIQHMLELRDLLAARKAEYELSIEPLKARYAKGEAYLTNRLEEAGHEKFSTAAGTVFTTTRVSGSVKDKGAFRDYVAETSEVDLLEIRVSQSALKEFIERTGGDVPPGVSVSTVRTLSIRRK